MIDGFLIVCERDGHSHILECYRDTIVVALKRLMPDGSRPWADDDEERNTLLELETTAGEPYLLRASAITSIRHSTAASRARTARIEAELAEQKELRDRPTGDRQSAPTAGTA